MSIYLYSDTGSGASETTQSNFTYGTRFKCSDARQITGIRWYRAATGPSRAPDKLRVYDSTDGSVKAQCTGTITDSGNVGWQLTAVDTPFTVIADRMYVVAAGWTGTNKLGVYFTGTPTAPSSPLSWGSTPPGCYSYASSTSYPDTSYATYYSVDAELAGSLNPPGDDSGTLTVGGHRNEMKRWLSSDSALNEFEGDLPWLTYGKLTDASVGLSAIAADVDTLLSRLTSARATAIDDINTSVGSGLGTNVSAIQTSLGSGFRTAFDALKTSWDAWRGASANAWDDIQDAMTASGQFWGKIGSATGFTPITYAAKLVEWLGSLGRGSDALVGDWVLSATSPLTGSLAWAQPADLYQVTFVTPPSNAVANDVDGVSWLGHMLWWAEWDGNIAGERRFLDFPAGFMLIPGRRMPGIIIRTNGVCDGTVSAWTYTAP